MDRLRRDRLDGDTAASGALVQPLAEIARLRHISIVAPAIEEVVARLHRRPPTASSATSGDRGAELA